MAGFHHVASILTISRTPLEVRYLAPGTYSFIPPTGVHEVSVVCVGGGSSNTGTTGLGSAGGGGALAWANKVPVSPGTPVEVIVAAAGTRAGGSTTRTNGGFSQLAIPGVFQVIATGGSNVFGGDWGFSSGFDAGGGKGGSPGISTLHTSGFNGGGGAGGYSGNGGAGGVPGVTVGSPAVNGVGGGQPGLGGGGGGGGSASSGGTSNNYAGGGGGVGIYGEGASGTGGLGGTTSAGSVATGGSGGSNGTVTRGAGIYGGGCGGSSVNVSGNGGNGAVRVLWGRTANGETRAFPSTNVGVI